MSKNTEISRIMCALLAVAVAAGMWGCGQKAAQGTATAVEQTAALETGQNTDQTAIHETDQAAGEAARDAVAGEAVADEVAAGDAVIGGVAVATGTEAAPGGAGTTLDFSDATVSYLGPAGTYTEEAAMFFFPDAKEMVPEETVDKAIADVVDGSADYAVIPQENTLGGAVTNYVDALISQKDVYVVGEVILPISQTLLGVPGAAIEDIKTVCSHAQGIKQSEKWRAEHMPEAVTQEMASTAAAASYVAEQQDKSIAAIAAPGAAGLYGLDILAENVQITDANKTRFYVLSAEEPIGGGFPRAVFVATCEAGRIDDIIVEIHESGVELVTIHDRPEGSALGTYYYVIEVENEGGITEEQLSRIGAIEEVRLIGRFASVAK